MLLLALDTATPLCGVAVVLANKLIETINPFVPKRPAAVRQERVLTHSGTLLTLVDEALAAYGACPGDLGAVVCSAGPGSFTGLRIGAATAKGLCFALNTPLVLVSTLESLAAPLLPALFGLGSPGESTSAPALVLSCIDAWQGQVYARVFAQDEVMRTTNLSADLFLERAWSPDDLADALAPVATSVRLCGDGALRYPRLRDLIRQQEADPYPNPLTLAHLGARRLLHGEHDNLITAAPNYICPPAIRLPPGVPS